MRNFSIMLLLPLVLLLDAKAQDTRVYQMRDGKVGISVSYFDTLLNVGSSKLKVLIDNETRETRISVNPSTFRTGIDSLDVKLQEGIKDDVVFRGHMNIPQLQTKGRSPQHFDVAGELTLNGETRPIMLQAALTHYEEGPGLESLLYLHVDVHWVDFGIDHEALGLSEFGCVEMLQGLKAPSSW